jgi:monoamine oxidase
VNKKFDVIMIGAGVAGMSAAVELARGGLSVMVLEARKRIGGRVFTEHDPKTGFPIEMGAEFIHGLPPEILEPLAQSNVELTEVDGDSWCKDEDDAGLKLCDFSSGVDEILQTMDDASPDESFLDFLNRCCPESADPRKNMARERALKFVSGFNAADPATVSVHWLVKGMRADELIQGSRAFHTRNGYSDLIGVFQKQMADAGINIQLETVVTRIVRTPGACEVSATDKSGSTTFTAPKVLITVPLAVLQASPEEAGAIVFSPPLPQEKISAMAKLELGKVIRVVLRFRERFWDTLAPDQSQRTLSDMSFLFADDKFFPTWWTTMPVKEPQITGWAPFEFAEQLSGKSKSFVTDQTLKSLARTLSRDPNDLEQLLDDAYLHDWQNDPFARGAYSYAKVGADGAQEALGRPVDGTLFFAGEATDVTGHNGTVHGAIASGHRAAKEILAQIR